MLKFVVGPPPEIADIVGNAAWKPLAGYDATGSSALRMLTVGLLSALLTYSLWAAFVPASLPISWPPIVLSAFVVATLMVVHEVLHILAFPGGGFGNTVAGFWPAKGAAYVGYTLPISRNRFIFVTLTPLAILSAGMLAAGILGLRFPVALQWASVLNAFGSGGDLVAVYLLARQSSSSSVVLESGQRLYTRVA
jgi:hypothetical protein